MNQPSPHMESSMPQVKVVNEALRAANISMDFPPKRRPSSPPAMAPNIVTTRMMPPLVALNSSWVQPNSWRKSNGRIGMRMKAREMTRLTTIPSWAERTEKAVRMLPKMTLKSRTSSLTSSASSIHTRRIRLFDFTDETFNRRPAKLKSIEPHFVRINLAPQV